MPAFKVRMQRVICSDAASKNRSPGLIWTFEETCLTRITLLDFGNCPHKKTNEILKKPFFINLCVA